MAEHAHNTDAQKLPLGGIASPSHSTRRRFFAFVGNAAVTGLVTTQATTNAATLILPPVGLIEPQRKRLGTYPLLAQHKTDMDAFRAISEGLTAPGIPEWMFLNWMEGGLRNVEGCKPGALPLASNPDGTCCGA